MKVTSKALAAAGVLMLVVAAYVAWLATSVLLDSRQMAMLCGTTMTDNGIVQVSTGLLVAGVLLSIGATMIIAAWRSRPHRGSKKTVD